MNIIRHKEFFDPLELKDNFHVIGCGAVGSHIASYLARLGIKHIELWDFDIVEDHNIPNQTFRHQDIDKPKVTALAEILKEINPDIEIEIHNKEYTDQDLEGYVFVCPDNIEVRKRLYEENQYNALIKAIFDTRIGLDQGQIFSANWSKPLHQKNLIATSNFNHEEVEEETTACGTKLAVLPTVVMVSHLAVSNFINFVKHKELKTLITFNSFNHTISK